MKATTGTAMQTSVTGGEPAQLRGLLDQWCAGRGVDKWIPPLLCEGAASVAAELGVHRVARELNLDFAQLKPRAARAASHASAGAQAPELLPDALPVDRMRAVPLAWIRPLHLWRLRRLDAAWVVSTGARRLKLATFGEFVAV